MTSTTLACQSRDVIWSRSTSILREGKHRRQLFEWPSWDTIVMSLFLEEGSYRRDGWVLSALRHNALQSSGKGRPAEVVETLACVRLTSKTRDPLWRSQTTKVLLVAPRLLSASLTVSIAQSRHTCIRWPSGLSGRETQSCRLTGATQVNVANIYQVNTQQCVFVCALCSRTQSCSAQSLIRVKCIN